MGKYLSKKILIYTSGVVILAIAIFLSFKNGNDKETATVLRADIVQEVAATGKVKPNQSVNLGFDKSGRVGSVFVSVGSVVEAGQILATLDALEISADLAKAKASLLEENIKLRELKSTAPISYNDAYQNLEAALNGGFADADNAVRNKADQFFKNSTSNPQFEVSFSDGNFVHYFNIPSNLVIEINNDRKKVETILVDWQKRIASINSSNLVPEANRAINDLNTISGFLDKVAGAVNTFTPAEYAYETTVNSYKTTIASARSSVSGAISAIVVAKDKLNTAPTLNDTGQFESVLTQEARVTQARAVVTSLEAALGKSSIVAPFGGVVILQDAKVGGTVSAGVPLISIMSQDEMYVEANISEINISKITIGDLVVVTLDAFADEEFLGEVSYIEPGDAIIDGVVNYKIRVNFKNFDTKIKSGLTANLNIQTDKREGVLTVPLYAVTKEGDQNFVNKIVGKNLQKIEVTLGLIGSNGMAEVLNGLNEGDLVGF